MWWQFVKYTNCINRAWIVGSPLGIIVKRWRSKPNHHTMAAREWPHPDFRRNHGPVGNVHLSVRSAKLKTAHDIIVAVCTVVDLPHTYSSIVVVHRMKPPDISNTGVIVSRVLQLCEGSRLSFDVL